MFIACRADRFLTGAALIVSAPGTVVRRVRRPDAAGLDALAGKLPVAPRTPES